MNNFKYRVLRIEPNITAVQKCAASVCVCVFSSDSSWTSSSLDVPAGVTHRRNLFEELISLLVNSKSGINRFCKYRIWYQETRSASSCHNQRSEKSLLRKSTRVLSNKSDKYVPPSLINNSEILKATHRTK